MAKVRTHLSRAFVSVDLAGTYAADGAFHSAARCLRQAVDHMEKAAAQSDRDHCHLFERHALSESEVAS